ncbi:hypothetical protein DFS34DRAFT_426045 [Phlyctochytrium arcticum]|nr:hypothetical protein DFS34DRAFT_426045 [Phlyctochytrium arcticum]
MTALSSLNINTNTTMTAVSAGNLANPSVDESTFKIVAAFCAILCVVTLAGGIFALLRIASDQTLLVANGLLYLGIATLFALPMTEVVRPSSASCMVQVVMAVPTLGFITSALLVKAHYYYTRHKNPLSLQQKLSQRETYWYNAIAGFIVLVYAVLVLSWLLIDRPAPVLVYIASSSERYYICGSSQTQPKFLFGLIGLTGPLILGALYLAKKVTDSPSIPARETQFIMLNAVNMRVLGAAMVGLMLGNFMAGSIQPAIRVTLEVMVAGVLGGSFLGFKIFDSMMKNHRANSEGGKMGTTSSWRMSFQTHSKRISTLDAARDAGSMVPVRPARLGQPLFHAPWRIYQIILTKVYMHLMPVARSRVSPHEPCSLFAKLTLVCLSGNYLFDSRYDLRVTQRGAIG